MPHIYDWLVSQQRIQCGSFKIDCSKDKIVLIFGKVSPFDKFSRFGRRPLYVHYKKSGTSTTIECSEMKSDIVVDDDFFTVCSEDLKEIIMEKTAAFSDFSVYHRHFFKRNVPADAETINITNRVYQFLKNVLELRDQKLRVNYACFHSVEVKPLIPILLLLDLGILNGIRMKITTDASLNYSDFLPLLNWKSSECSRLQLKLKQISIQSLHVIKKLIENSPGFDTILAQSNNWETRNLKAIFSLSRLTQQIFSLYVERIPREDNKEEASLETSLQQLSIQEDVYSKVLENSLIMKIMMKEFQLFDIQRLRSVSQGISRCVERVKPDPQIESIHFSVIHDKAMNANFTLRNLQSRKFDALFDNWSKEKNSSALEDDFERVQSFFDASLKNQKSPLKVFRLHFDVDDESKSVDSERKQSPENCEQRKCETSFAKEFFMRFKLILNSGGCPVKVKKLIIEMSTTEYVFGVMHSIDSSDLEEIEILNPHERWPEYRSNLMICLAEVSKLNQWKNAKHLVVHRCRITSSIQNMNITHFENLDILVQRVSSDDILYLKTELLKSATLQKFKISFQPSDEPDNIEELMGAPFRRIHVHRRVWFFRMTNLNNFIHIVYDSRSSIVFVRVDLNSVPEQLL